MYLRFTLNQVVISVIANAAFCSFPYMLWMDGWMDITEQINNTVKIKVSQVPGKAL